MPCNTATRHSSPNNTLFDSDSSCPQQYSSINNKNPMDNQTLTRLLEETARTVEGGMLEIHSGTVSRSSSVSHSPYDEEDDEDDEDEDVSDVLVPKKRYIRRKVYFPAYRVVKSDLRRKYGVMLNNCTNSGDIFLFTSFLEQFALPNIHYNAVVSPPTPHLPGFPTQTKRVILDTREQYLRYTAGIMNILPDFTARISNMKIRTRSKTQACQIEYTVSYTGTVMHVVAVSEIATHAKDKKTLSEHGKFEDSPTARLRKRPHSQESPSSSGNSSPTHTAALTATHTATLTAAVEESTTTTHVVPNTPVFIQKPVQISLQGVITIFIDENRFISGVQFRS